MGGSLVAEETVDGSDGSKEASRDETESGGDERATVTLGTKSDLNNKQQ